MWRGRKKDRKCTESKREREKVNVNRKGREREMGQRKEMFKNRKIEY
jgi:hypothetical protein